VAAWLLAQYVMLGAAIYVTVGIALWLLSGRPEGAEWSVLRVLGTAWSQITGRLAPARS